MNHGTSRKPSCNRPESLVVCERGLNGCGTPFKFRRGDALTKDGEISASLNGCGTPFKFRRVRDVSRATADVAGLNGCGTPFKFRRRLAASTIDHQSHVSVAAKRHRSFESATRRSRTCDHQNERNGSVTPSKSRRLVRRRVASPMAALCHRKQRRKPPYGRYNIHRKRREE